MTKSFWHKFKQVQAFTLAAVLLANPVIETAFGSGMVYAAEEDLFSDPVTDEMVYEAPVYEGAAAEEIVYEEPVQLQDDFQDVDVWAGSPAEFSDPEIELEAASETVEVQPDALIEEAYMTDESLIQEAPVAAEEFYSPEEAVIPEGYTQVEQASAADGGLTAAPARTSDTAAAEQQAEEAAAPAPNAFGVQTKAAAEPVYLEIDALSFSGEEEPEVDESLVEVSAAAASASAGRSYSLSCSGSTCRDIGMLSRSLSSHVTVRQAE